MAVDETLETTGADQRARIAELETQIVELQRQLAEQATRTNAAIAAAEERAYWLDRWHVDLNALMRRPGAAQFRALLRAARVVARTGRRVRRALRGP